MSAEENVELVKRGYTAFKEGDMETLLGLFAEDIEWTTPSVEGAPFGGTLRGHNQVLEFFAALAAAEDIQEFDQTDFIAQNDRVVVTGRTKARIRSTGRTVENEYVHLFTIDGGKVQRFLEFFDTAVATDAYRKSAGAGA